MFYVYYVIVSVLVIGLKHHLWALHFNVEFSLSLITTEVHSCWGKPIQKCKLLSMQSKACVTYNIHTDFNKLWDHVQNWRSRFIRRGNLAIPLLINVNKHSWLGHDFICIIPQTTTDQFTSSQLSLLIPLTYHLILKLSVFTPSEHIIKGATCSSGYF